MVISPLWLTSQGMELILIRCQWYLNLHVFPKKITSLPLNRKIKFTIEVLPGTTSVAKTPYRMALLELKELKFQLQKLLDIRFIWPNASPWKGPILFIRNKNRSLRLYIKYRGLNSVIIKNKHQFLDELFDLPKGAKLYTKFDLQQGITVKNLWQGRT